MQVTQKDYLNYLYEKLPPVYRDYDAKLKYPLKRYLECIVTGAFKPTLDLISSMLLLLDPEKCPIQYLPYLCQSFGVTYHPEVEERFQRKYLKNIIEIYKRKGTHSIIAFIAREIVGFEVYTYEAQYNILRTWESPEVLLRRGQYQTKLIGSEGVRSSAAGYLLGNYYNSKTMVIRFFTDDASTFESKKTALEAYLYDLIPVKAQVSYEFVSPN